MAGQGVPEPEARFARLRLAAEEDWPSPITATLVGVAARQHGRRLASSDARARPVYDALGVKVELIP